MSHGGKQWGKDEVVKKVKWIFCYNTTSGLSESWWQAVKEDEVVKRLNGFSAISQPLV